MFCETSRTRTISSKTRLATRVVSGSTYSCMCTESVTCYIEFCSFSSCINPEEVHRLRASVKENRNSYSQGHGLHLFHAVVTPTITYGAGTWVTTEEHEKCSALHSTECFDSSSRQRENTNKTKKETGGKDIRMFPVPHVTVGVTTASNRCNRCPSK